MPMWKMYSSDALICRPNCRRYAASRATGRVRYRRRKLTTMDWALAVAAWIAPVTFVALSAADDRSLVWPGATVGIPALNVVAIAGLAALAVPVLRRSAA